jgi:hypothetical protein
MAVALLRFASGNQALLVNPKKPRLLLKVITPVLRLGKRRQRQLNLEKSYVSGKVSKNSKPVTQFIDASVVAYPERQRRRRE